jgi:molybdopterin-guanine dinucleotide biosynthesis protein A
LTDRARPRRAGVVILAGGEATRLPGKLALDVGGIPLILRVFRNLSSGRETFVSCKGTFAAETDALLDAALVVDRWSRRGPLAGVVSAMSRMASPLVFAAAGDAPFVTSSLIDALEAARRAGDEAVVPMHPDADGAERLEPLAALYDRVAVLREGGAMLRERRYSMHGLLSRLRVRRVRAGDALTFANVNTRASYERAVIEARREVSAG